MTSLPCDDWVRQRVAILLPADAGLQDPLTFRPKIEAALAEAVGRSAVEIARLRELLRRVVWAYTSPHPMQNLFAVCQELHPEFGKETSPCPV